MKRTIAGFLAVLLSFCAIFGSIGFAEGENAQEQGTGGAPIDTHPFSVEAEGAILMEAATGTILFAQNERHAASPASVTKIMTLLLTMEAIDSGRIALNDRTRISRYAASMGGSQVFLEEGEEMSVEELLKCTVISSANDAAVALAELVSGSEAAFVSKMNARAAELNMTNSNFENVTGLDDTTTDHVTCALDIAIMSRALLRHRKVLEYSSLWQDSIRNGAFTLTNTNRLVRFYEGCNGLKTGSTAKAGYCVSVSAKRGNLELIAVIMGAGSRDARNDAARTLLDYGFSNFALYEDARETVDRLPVRGARITAVRMYHPDFCCVVDKSRVDAVERFYEFQKPLTAPVEEDQVLGRIVYRVEGTVIGEVALLAEEAAEKIVWIDIFLGMLRHIVSG